MQQPTMAHLINPYACLPETPEHKTQQLVLQSIVNAHENSAQKEQVRLFAAYYHTDQCKVPYNFTLLPPLTRSVADIKSFKTRKNYPLMADLLHALYNHTNADYFVYTNMDIILMPFFYDVVFSYIQQGYDAFAINRRRISKYFLNNHSLQEIYAEIGKSHPGFDCFVFRRTLLPHFIMKNICIGIPFVEATLIYNMVAFSNRFRLFPDKHLTVHIGMEVMPRRDKEYFAHNKQEFQKYILPQLKPYLKAKNLPYAELPFYQRFIKWGLNPAVFILLNTELEAKGWLERLRLLKDEIRFHWLQKD